MSCLDYCIWEANCVTSEIPQLHRSPSEGQTIRAAPVKRCALLLPSAAKGGSLVRLAMNMMNVDDAAAGDFDVVPMATATTQGVKMCQL